MQPGSRRVGLRNDSADRDRFQLENQASNLTLQADSVATVENFRQSIAHISRQSAFFFAGTIFTAAAGYVFRIYVAKALGAEALGVYALGMTLVAFLGVFNALGFSQSAVRFVASYCATGKLDLLRGFLARTLGLLLFCSIVLGGTTLLAGPWIVTHLYHTPALRSYLPLFALILVFGALNTFLGQVLAGYKDVARRTVITNFIGSPVAMVGTFVLIGYGLSLWGYLFAQIAAATLVFGLLAASVWKLTPNAARSGGLPPLQQEVIHFSATVFGMDFLCFLMAQTDKILIGVYLGAREVGIYAVAMALVAFVPIVLQSVNQVFSPIIADLHARGQFDALNRIFQTLTKWILGLTFPLAAAMIVYAQPLMRMFGRDFEAGWTILMIGTVGQLVNCAAGSVGYLLLMSGNQKRLIKIQTAMAIVTILMNLALVPRWGVTGAAAASALTNIAMNLWCLRDVQRALDLFPYNRNYFRLAFPAAGTILALLLSQRVFSTIRPEWIGVALALAAAYAIFFTVALALGLDADDRLITEAVWPRIRAAFCSIEVTA